MDLNLLITTMFGCFAIGVVLSAPMGPIGILTVQRTLNKGRDAGWWTGIGAAVSDLIYCLLTGLGMSFVNNFIEPYTNELQILGSIILLVFAIYLIKRNPAKRIEDNQEHETHYQDMWTGFFFTLSNPLIIFLIVPLFARFKFPTAMWAIDVVGYMFIAVGAVAWWSLITFLVNAIRSHFTNRTMWLINIVIGCIILVLALYGLMTGIAQIVK